MSRGKTIIKELESIRGVSIECPECGETFSPRSAKLFSVRDDLPPSVKKYIQNKNDELKQELIDIAEQRKELRARGKEKPERVKVTVESVNFGKIIEKIIPAFHNFPYNSLDCRALYEPIDYIVFKGLAKKGIVESIVFTDVKSGSARLKDNQKQIKHLVGDGKVKLTVADHE